MRTRIEQKKLRTDFILDLAPLLSVMVKLVPVLLLSSAFVQMASLTSPLPGVASSENVDSDFVTLVVVVKTNGELHLRSRDQSGQVTDLNTIKSISDAKIDHQSLQKILVQLKNENPKMRRFEIKPEPQVNLQQLIQVMDAARAQDQKPLFDDIVFATVSALLLSELGERSC